ncbi:hypothetical protein PanWU01x14_353950, partial [Parasponia andersonii]
RELTNEVHKLVQGIVGRTTFTYTNSKLLLQLLDSFPHLLPFIIQNQFSHSSLNLSSLKLLQFQPNSPNIAHIPSIHSLITKTWFGNQWNSFSYTFESGIPTTMAPKTTNSRMCQDFPLGCPSRNASPISHRVLEPFRQQLNPIRSAN